MLCYMTVSRDNIVHRLMRLELEEKILNGSSFIAFICVFFPWIGGEWLGRPVSYSGFGFFISFIGLSILLLHAFLLLICILPLAGGSPIVRRKYRDAVRLFIAMQTVVLTVVAWSVLTEFTLEFSRLEIHFGLYGTLIASLITTLYAFLKFQQERKTETEHLFRHVHEEPEHTDQAEFDVPLPPSEEPEEYRLH